MATEEHKHLANIIKKTHILLRTEYQQYGAETAWRRHIARCDLQVCANRVFQKLSYLITIILLAAIHLIFHFRKKIYNQD